MFASINGKRVYLWRAVDSESEVLDILVQSRRNRKAALKLMRKLLKSQGFVPDQFVTEIACAHNGLLTSNLGKKVSMNLGAIHYRVGHAL
ncbi:DDE-type integrase/transposase/recombinase [Pelagibius sp. Alg239-R121]|uniref:DDE-type integrase/transposase/recombinase n=1 Tax=Pelagibius sp. Alg239-R121 TaxID=2993448 RepID=UPI0034610E3F